jgi:hypothetical protein
MNMSNFSKLSFAESLPAKPVDKLAQRRMRLVEHLKQQIALATNPKLTIQKEFREKDEETGEITVKTVERPVRSWVKVGENKAFISCKVGVRPIEFAKGKKFIVCKPTEVKQTLQTLMDAASEGELDEHIAALFDDK